MFTYIALGSNLGDRLSYISTATQYIQQRVGRIVQSSDLYETDAWGVTDQPTYYNKVLEVETNLQAEEILALCLAIETELGRVRSQRWGARTIDIDILLHKNQIIDSESLTLPHPRMHERKFVLLPLSTIAPHEKHPIFRATIQTLLTQCTDTLLVKLVLPSANHY